MYTLSQFYEEFTIVEIVNYTVGEEMATSQNREGSKLSPQLKNSLIYHRYTKLQNCFKKGYRSLRRKADDVKYEYIPAVVVAVAVGRRCSGGEGCSLECCDQYLCLPEAEKWFRN